MDAKFRAKVAREKILMAQARSRRCSPRDGPDTGSRRCGPEQVAGERLAHRAAPRRPRVNARPVRPSPGRRGRDHRCLRWQARQPDWAGRNSGTRGPRPGLTLSSTRPLGDHLRVVKRMAISSRTLRTARPVIPIPGPIPACPFTARSPLSRSAALAPSRRHSRCATLPSPRQSLPEAPPGPRAMPSIWQ